MRIKNVISKLRIYQIFAVGCVIGCLALNGCEQGGVEKAVGDAGKAASEAGKAASAAAGEAAEAGKGMLEGLSEQATGFLNPLKDKFTGLADLKDKPEQLKEAVNGLISSMEGKLDGLGLPDAVKTALEGVLEKLVGLKDYLAGEAEEAGITDKVNGIMESVKGMGW